MVSVHVPVVVTDAAAAVAIAVIVSPLMHGSAEA